MQEGERNTAKERDMGERDRINGGEGKGWREPGEWITADEEEEERKGGKKTNREER